jgi:hypothetical protein
MKISNFCLPYMATDEALTSPNGGKGGMTHLLWDETLTGVLDSHASPAEPPVLENTE